MIEVCRKILIIWELMTNVQKKKKCNHVMWKFGDATRFDEQCNEKTKMIID